MGDDERLGQFGERLARLEARYEAIPTNGELISTAGSAGKMAAGQYMDGLKESFQKQTNARLGKLETTVGRMRGHMVLVNAVVLVLGFIAGQKLPTFIP